MQEVIAQPTPLTSCNSVCRHAANMRSFEFSLPPNHVFVDEARDEDALLVVLKGRGRLFPSGAKFHGPELLTARAHEKLVVAPTEYSQFLLVHAVHGTVLSQSKALATADYATRELYKKIALMPQFDGCETTHYFSGRIYARRVRRPADVFVIGCLHKFEHLTVLLSGEMSYRTHDGVARVTAPAVLVSGAGTKRWTYAHRDAELMTIHCLPTAEMRDFDAIEAHLVEQEPDMPRLFDIHNKLKPLEVTRQ